MPKKEKLLRFSATMDGGAVAGDPLAERAEAGEKKRGCEVFF